VALDTYANLQTAIGKFLNRTDLAASIPDFITLTEAAVNRVLKTPRMHKRATAPIDSQFFIVPTDWLRTVRFQVQASQMVVLELAGYDEIADYRMADDTPGTPRFYCHIGTMFEVYPTPNASFPADLLYVGMVPALSTGNPTNWLLTLSPDVYLYGALMAAAPYLQHDDRLPVWGGLYARAITELNDYAEQALASGTGLRLRMR
jgi:hypothetical protein